MLSQDTIDEFARHEESNNCYYRPLTFEGFATLACMQWFDEYDYDKKRFFRDKDGERYHFDTEEEGIKWLIDNIKPDKIDPEYRNISFDDYYK